MNKIDPIDLLESGEIVSISPPKLDSVEKLYVRAYLSKLSHSYAHSVVSPGIKKPKEDNPFSRRANVQFFISKELQTRMEAMDLTPEKIIERLYLEATREGRDASHTARISALTTLGKHLGLFKETKEKENFTFNIVNYSDKPVDIELPNTVEPDESEEILDTGIFLTNYSEEENDS